MHIHQPDQFITAIIFHTLWYIRSNASCKYCMDSAPISSVINVLPQLFCTSCTSVIFIWNEHIKSYMCWPCLQQLSIQFLPCLGVFKTCLNAPFLGKSNMSCIHPNCPAREMWNHGPETTIKIWGHKCATPMPKVPTHVPWQWTYWAWPLPIPYMYCWYYSALGSCRTCASSKSGVIK